MENSPILSSPTWLNWGLLSEYRGALMGVAIIWVIFYHAVEWNLNFPVEAINSFLLLGFIGVEIFLFVSGIGLYFSFSKNSNIIQFYGKRLKRILVPYLLLAIPFFLWQDVYLEQDWLAFIKNITLYSFWTDGVLRVWYIGLIIPLYILFPFIYKFIELPGKKSAGKYGRGIRTAILIVLCVFFAKFLHTVCPGYYDGVEIAITRIPIFIFGCYCGKLVKEKQPVAIWQLALILTLAMLIPVFGKYDFSHLEMRFLRSALAVALCWDFVLVFSFFRKGMQGKPGKFLELCGAWSLELYLTHVLVRRILKYYDFSYTVNGVYLNENGVVSFILMVIFTIIIATIVHYLSKFLLKHI